MNWLAVNIVVLVCLVPYVTSVSTLGNGVLTRKQGPSNTMNRLRNFCKTNKKLCSFMADEIGEVRDHGTQINEIDEAVTKKDQHIDSNLRDTKETLPKTLKQLKDKRKVLQTWRNDARNKVSGENTVTHFDNENHVTSDLNILLRQLSTQYHPRESAAPIIRYASQKDTAYDLIINSLQKHIAALSREAVADMKNNRLREVLSELGKRIRLIRLQNALEKRPKPYFKRTFSRRKDPVDRIKLPATRRKVNSLLRDHVSSSNVGKTKNANTRLQILALLRRVLDSQIPANAKR